MHYVFIQKHPDHFLILSIVLSGFFLEKLHTCPAQRDSYLHGLILVCKFFKKRSQRVRFVEMIPARDSREEAEVRLELNGIGSIQFRELPASEYLSSLISGITGNH